ncbi:MAG: MBL fold metallo-hydrolase [Kofleriaceae bacterium]|nr:MBL fold metallo-hydrolase [Kofleriaceae bacterium]
MHISQTIVLSALLLGACGASEPTPSGTAPSEPESSVPQQPNLSYRVFTGDEKGFYATSTLIEGESEAILIDAQFNLANGQRLADWIALSHKSLAAIYITHAHPDHYFGVEKVLEKFPGTPIFANRDVVDSMRTLAPGKLAYWGPIYGDDLTTSPPLPKPLTRSYFELGQHRLNIIELDQADSEHASAVHVPALDLLVAGDLVFSGVHAWVADTPKASDQQAWIHTLEKILDLHAVAVVPGHRSPGRLEDPIAIGETLSYLRDFARLRAVHNSPSALTEAMLTLHGNDKLPIILEIAAKASFSAP